MLLDCNLFLFFSWVALFYPIWYPTTSSTMCFTFSPSSTQLPALEPDHSLSQTHHLLCPCLESYPLEPKLDSTLWPVSELGQCLTDGYETLHDKAVWFPVIPGSWLVWFWNQNSGCTGTDWDKMQRNSSSLSSPVTFTTMATILGKAENIGRGNFPNQDN